MPLDVTLLPADTLKWSQKLMARSQTDRILQALIAVLLVALLAVLGDTMRDRVVGVGDRAPHFSIRTDGGLTVSQSDFGGKVLVLNFWATWCPPCIEELPSLSAMYERLKSEGVVVLGVSVDEDEAAYRGFVENHRITFLTARDPDASISDRYGTYRYPETYIIGSNGKVVQKIVGPTTWDDERMISYLRSLL